MASLSYEVRKVVITGVAKSDKYKETHFEFPITVRVPVDCEEIKLEIKSEH